MTHQRRDIVDGSKESGGGSPPKKRPYMTPSLIDYGNVAKLTQSGQGTEGDGGLIGSMMMMCL